MDEDNDGRFPDDSLVRYPRSRQEELADRAGWPWLPGTILSQCGPDEWYVCVEARELATLDDGSPAPAGTAYEDLFFPCCFGTPPRPGASPAGRTGDPGGGGGQLVLLAGDHRRAGRGLHPATVIGIARRVEGLGLVICLNTIPAGWPAALILACLMPRKEISHAPYRQRPRGR